MTAGSAGPGKMSICAPCVMTVPSPAIVIIGKPVKMDSTGTKPPSEPMLNTRSPAPVGWAIPSPSGWPVAPGLPPGPDPVQAARRMDVAAAMAKAARARVLRVMAL